MTTFNRIISELSQGHSTSEIRRVARKGRSAKVIDSTAYKAAVRSCNVLDLITKGRYVV